MKSQWRRTLLALLSTGVLLGVFLHAQGDQARKLGPDTAKSIQQARLDPSFQTTKLNRVMVLPFANTPQYKDGASIVSKNLVAQLSQFHPDYTFVSPEKAVNDISSAGLNDEFNVFLGDYLAAGTASRVFLDNLREKLQVDAVFIGHITHWGQTEAIGKAFLTGKPVKVKFWAVGVEMSLYRTTDGRRIWSGKDLLNAGKENKLPETAGVISEIFARFFGRTTY